MKRFLLSASAIVLALCLAREAPAACLSAQSLSFKDAGGATQVLCFGGSAGQYLGQTEITDSSGNIVGATSNALDINIKSGNISGFALDTSVNGLLLTQGGSITSKLGPLVFGSVTTAKPAYTTAQTSPLSLDTSGLLRISWADTPVNATKLLVTPDSVALPLHQSVNVDEVAGQVLGAIANYGTSPGAVLVPGMNAFVTNTVAVNTTQLGGTAIAVNSGNTSAGTQRVVIATDQPALTNALNVACTSGCSASSPTDTTSTGSLAAGGNTVQVALAGDNGAAVEFPAGTSPLFTVVPEVSTDGGTTWSLAVFIDPVSGAISNNIVNPASQQAGIAWALGGVSHARVRVSSFTSGSNTANLRATANRPFVVNYGSDGTNIRPIAQTTAGLTKVDISGTAANGTAIKVDGSSVTQPVSESGTWNVGLSTGSNTIGKVDILGNAAATMDTTPGGTAATNALQVQGVAGMTKLLVTPDSVALPLHQSTNVDQWNGVTVLANTGAVGTGSPRVAVGTDSATIAGSAPGTTEVIPSGCAGQTNANTLVQPINISTATTTSLVTGVSAKKIYICSINLVAAAADNVALVESSVSVCASSITGMAGGATAATGWNFTANGGLTLGNGRGVVFKTATAANNVCLMTSAATQLSGSITYAQF